MSGNPESAAGLKAFLMDNYVETLGLIPMLTLLILLAFIVRIDRYIRADLKRTMRFIILAAFSLVAQNFLDYRLAEGEVKWLARTLTSIYGYVIRPVILILFLRFIAPEVDYGGHFYHLAQKTPWHDLSGAVHAKKAIKVNLRNGLGIDASVHKKEGN